jgi:TonB family protein
MQMTMPNYIKSYPQLTSIMLHMLVFFSVIFYFDFSAEKITLGQDIAQVVNSYVYQHHTAAKMISAASQNQAAPAERIQRVVAANGIQKVIPIKKRVVASPKSASRSAQSFHQESPPSHGHETSELIALLHAAIQKQQHYPASALQLEREGRVKVKFTLDTHGMVSNLQVAESSGTSSLDEAALSAVKNAAPFAEAMQYLHEPQVYNIDVAFELT